MRDTSKAALVARRDAQGPERYVSQFERFTAGRQRDAAWLRQLRSRAIDRFAELGFPTLKDEEWKFTSVGPIAETPFHLAENGVSAVSADEVSRLGLEAAGGCRLVFVNGRYVPALSNARGLPAGPEGPEGVLVTGLAAALPGGPEQLEASLGRIAPPDRHPFVALNTAFLSDGAFVRIPANAVIERPIHLMFLSTGGEAPTVSHPRVLIVAGENSQVRVIESYAAADVPTAAPGVGVGAGAGRGFTNAVTEVEVGPNAVVDHYKLQREPAGAFHLATMQVRAGRGSSFSSHSLTFGGGLVRNEVTAALGGEGVDCTLNGLYLADGRALVDNHTTIDHVMPHCGSHEIYKGILAGRSRAVFNGKIIVRPDAQKTDAKQTNKALLLSDEAQINTKPQLEIFANDVKCTHGAAVGQLDEDAIFYLRARGLAFEEARDLLIHAFAGDILNRIKIDALRATAEAALLARLPRPPKN